MHSVTSSRWWCSNQRGWGWWSLNNPAHWCLKPQHPHRLRYEASTTLCIDVWILNTPTGWGMKLQYPHRLRYEASTPVHVEVWSLSSPARWGLKPQQPLALRSETSAPRGSVNKLIQKLFFKAYCTFFHESDNLFLEIVSTHSPSKCRPTPYATANFLCFTAYGVFVNN